MLKKAAKKSGGDSFHGTLKCGEGKIVSEINLYIPQDISRRPAMSKPHEKIMMKICIHDTKEELIEPGEGEDIVQVKLTQTAKSSGGDKYEGNLSNGVKFTPYIPQCFSRMSKPERHKRLVVAFKQYDRKKRLAEMASRMEAKKKKVARVIVDDEDDDEDVPLSILRPTVKIEMPSRVEGGSGNVAGSSSSSSSSSNSSSSSCRGDGNDEEYEKELREHYEMVYTEEARRINSTKMTFDALKENIATGKLHVLGRTFDQHREYKTFMNKVRSEWSSGSDFILAERIGVPYVIGTDGKKTVIRSEMLVDPRFQGKLFFLENDFPYNFESNMKHFCLWKIGGEINVEGSDCEIRGEMAKIGYPAARLNDTWCYYINPPNLKSVHDIDHAHIIIRVNS